MPMGTVCSCGTLYWSQEGSGDFTCQKCAKPVVVPTQFLLGPSPGGFTADDMAIMRTFQAQLQYETAVLATQTRATLVLMIFAGVVVGGVAGAFLAFGTHYGLVVGAATGLAIVLLSVGVGWWAQEMERKAAIDALPQAQAERAAKGREIQQQNPAFVARLGGVEAMFDDQRLQAALAKWIVERRNNAFSTFELEMYLNQ